ncbi:MAG: YeeE/YedE thiosulfate transporter family protein [Thermoanaerobaculia bacterium]
MAMITAFAIGVAFGFALERAGLGSARKLIGQFYGTDFTVFKVMFSAIVTAMLGAFWLSRLGFVDLSSVYVPRTWLLPQLAGGLIFGVGFVVAGLCPGTSCVAAASGRGDGFAVVVGIFAGVLVAPHSDSTPRGAWTLPELLDVPYGVVVFAVVLIALAGFAVAERIEKRA